MFILEGKLTFINIEQSYLKKLHDACSEVYYKPSGYENKPYIGILINKNDRKYVIPLSSAKEKHKTWKNVDKECYLVYEMAKKSSMAQGDIWVAAEEDDVKHILSVMGVKTQNLAIPLTRKLRINSAFVPLHIAKIYILKLCLDEEIIPRCRFPCSRGYFRKCINWQKKQ